MKKTPKRPAPKSKRAKTAAADELTPEQRREINASIAIGEAQAKAGLTYGPFDAIDDMARLLSKAHETKKRISIEIPRVLIEYLEREAKRLGLTAAELIVTILETHQFADRDRQLIIMAIAESTDRFKTGRYEA